MNEMQEQRLKGFDTLLCHLLVTRIPVMYKHSSKSIPEYLS